VRVLRELKQKYVGFLDEEDQQHTMACIEEKTQFTNCIGSGDGFLVQFGEKPLVEGTQYLGRKDFFGVCFLYYFLLLKMTFRHRQLFKLQLITVPGLPHMKLVGQLQ
jgi:hypothetical protein